MRLVLSALLVLSAVVWGQETLQDVKKQIKAVEKETAVEKELASQEKKRHSDYVEITKQKINALAEQNKLLQAQMDSLKSEANQLNQARTQVLSIQKWVEGRKLRYRESLVKHMDSIAKVLQNDIPFKREEAVTTIQENAKLLKQGLVSPEEALSRTFDVLMERVYMGTTTESWSGFLNWQSRTLSGRFVRFGGVSAIFASNDSQEYLWLNLTKNGYEWVPVAKEASIRAIFKESVKVAEGKAPPALVFMPFVVMQGGK